MSPELASLVEAALTQAGRPVASGQLEFRAIAGNPDRKDHQTLRRYAICRQNAPLALLILGPELAQLENRIALFARHHPAISCPIIAANTASQPGYILTEYFAGQNAADALSNPAIGETGVVQALEKLAKIYAASERPSTADAAKAELDALLDQVAAIPFWTPLDRSFLQTVVAPLAKQLLLTREPHIRVTNGDLALQNLLIAEDGSLRVIDCEQAAETHFFAEDWLRLSFWKAPKAVREAALKQIADPTAARLLFYLRQMAFEAAVIQTEKARADIGHWARELRGLATQATPAVGQSLFWPQNREPNQAQPATAETDRAKILDLFHYARHTANEVGRCEAKIQSMQRSRSWRCTAWLRALRRLLLDPRHKPASRPVSPPPFPFAVEDFLPAQARLHHHLDTSEETIVPGRQVAIEGWVFANEPPHIVQVRARAGTRIFTGEHGLDRPEIAEKFLPQASSRFRVEVDVAPDATRLDLEALDENGEWTLFFSKRLGRSMHPTASWASSTEAIRSRYEHWVRLYDSPTSHDLNTQARKSQKLPHRPTISLLMPVYNAPEPWLARAIESVREQSYPFWELCIADDASTQPHVRTLLEREAKADPRIKVVYRTANGHIAAASNSALELATGEFVACLDHDDELAPNALFHCAELLARHRDAEVVYSDEDKIDEQGRRFDPHFKPDWNPDLLLSQNYLSHLTLYRTRTVRELGGFRVGFEGSQDWDLALRVTEKTEPAKIHHIPRVLYRWRAVAGSTASHLREKSYASTAAGKVLREHLARKNSHASLEMVKGSHWRIRHPIPDPAPLVTLVIPTRNGRELLATCIESIRAKTRYPNFEFLIADNGSDDPALPAFYEKQKSLGRFSVLPCPGPFNYSAINNRAVKAAAGTLVGLLNNDLEAIHPDWLDEMVAHALRPGIGVVGAKLYYPDMRIQHAGVVTGLGGVAGHAFKKFPRNDPGTPQFRPHVVHNVSAVTAACVVLRKAVFEQAGGLDEENLKVAFNDVDFCLRVEALGYRNLFTPFAELIHHESASRGAEDSPEKLARFAQEIAYMKSRWGQRLVNDPAYNPNLTLDTEDFAYAFPPRQSPG